MAPPPRKRTKLAADQPTEILFDISARQNYLTGFHKRKVARKEHAKEQAIVRAKEEKIEARRQVREQRKADLAQHVIDVNNEYRKMNPDLSSDEDEELVDDIPTVPEVTQEEEEYVDEDKFTTVTVEPMGETSEEESSKPIPVVEDKSKKKMTQPKKKKKKFRYETKAERKDTRMKQKAKNKRAADARKEK